MASSHWLHPVSQQGPGNTSPRLSQLTQRPTGLDGHALLKKTRYILIMKLDKTLIDLSYCSHTSFKRHQIGEEKKDQYSEVTL